MAENPTTKASSHKAKQGRGASNHEDIKPRKLIGPWIFTVAVAAATVISGLKGNWHDWWLEFLLIPIGVIAISILVYEVLRYNLKVLPFHAIGCAAVSFVLIGFSIFIFYRLNDGTWKPPELPEDCQNVHIILGIGIEVDYAVSNLVIKPFSNVSFMTRTPEGGVAMIDLSGKGREGFKIDAEIRNNRLYIHAPIPVGLATNQQPILMNENLDAFIPATWDRNYNLNAFEIVDEDFLPVFQVIYKRPDVVQVNGVFIGKNGLVIGFGRGQIFIPAPSALPKIPERKALFLYPASLHRGELAPVTTN